MGPLWWIVFACSIPSLYGEQYGNETLRKREMHCNVTQDRDQTNYTIVNAPPGSEEGCDYSWANSTGHVLANNDEKHMLVKTKGIHTLSTSKCIDSIIYEKSCLSNGKVHRALCNVSCRGDHQDQEHKSGFKSEVEWVPTAIGIAIGTVTCIGIVVIVLVLVVPWSRCTEFIDLILRRSWIAAYIYSAVTQNPANQTADPVNQAADPVNQTADPANQTADPVNQTADPANQAADPANQAADPVNQAADPANQAADPVNQAADPVNQAAVAVDSNV